MPSRVFALLVCLLLMCSAAWGQQSFGSITGTVSDPQGARIPAASVTITNTDTNTVSRMETNTTGYFEVNLLNPGNYTITVEASGFKRVVRTGLVLNVAGRLDVPVQLEIGAAAETISVTAEAPMLDTTTASGGRVLDNRQIMQLPFSDMNPFALATLAPGMQWTGQPEYRRPFDNGGTSSFNTSGGVGSNEYTIDGASVTGTNRRVGFTPPSDAVEEFRLETTTFDASYGNTSGATINVSTKAGTNTLHGSAYDQHWQQRWNATPHFRREDFNTRERLGLLKPGETKQATGRSNNYGFTLGGPVLIPKIFDGRDKLFFFFSYNGIRQSKAETTDSLNRTVPRMAWRQGDFSDLLAIDPVKYQIYDPRSARLVSGRVVRDPFPGNKGIPVLNPMYKFYEKLYPVPNEVPGLASAEGFNNYLASAMPKDEKFFSFVNRIDYNISQRHRVFGRWYWNDRLADEYDWTYETMRGLHSNGLTRINKGGGGDWIWTITNTTLMDLGVSWTRFNEGSRSQIRNSFKPSDVGLPAYLDERAGDFHHLPRLDFNNIEDFSTAYQLVDTRGTTAEAKLQLTSILGSHSLKYGYNERLYMRTVNSPGTTSGSFQFRNNYMKADDVINTASHHGLEWAAFMMGLPNSVSVDRNDSAFATTPTRAIYLHDDWRLTNQLRLNLGLRYEYQGSIRERYNRAVANFDFNAILPISELAQQAYARNPVAEVPASQFKVIGGNTYLGQPNETWTQPVHTFLPRVGVVYSLNDKTVIRAGYGRFYDVLNVLDAVPGRLGTPGQDGYSQSTGTPITNDNGLTFCCGIGAAGNLSSTRNVLVDPFPVRADGTRFNEPYGNVIGSMIRVGRGMKIMPYEFVPASQNRFRFSIQRQLRDDIVIEAAYNHGRSRFFPFGETDARREVMRIDYLPPQYWATGMQRDQARDDYLNQNVPNPFRITNFEALRNSNPVLYNYMASQAFFTSTNIARHRLLRAYPHMNNLFGLRPGEEFGDAQGNNIYHDFQLQAEKRFSRGFQMAVMYTWATASESDYYFNEWDDRPVYRIANDVRPHRFVWTTIWEMPFGKGRSHLTSGPLQHIVGGWTLSWVYQRQSGPAFGFGDNRFFYGDINKIEEYMKHDEVHSKDIRTWFDPSLSFRPLTATGSVDNNAAIPAGFVGFEGRSGKQPGSYHVRMIPRTWNGVREDGIRNWDVKIDRKFRITEQIRTSFSVDLLNATNHTNFSGLQTDPTNTNFGKLTNQRGLSRIIQLNLRVDF